MRLMNSILPTSAHSSGGNSSNQLAGSDSSGMISRASVARSTTSKEKKMGYTEHIEHQRSETLRPRSTGFSSRWARYRAYLREPFAEFLGTCFLIIFGAGVDCQAVLGGDSRVAASPKGSYLSINVGWAVGTAMGVWVSGGISGGHINPAVTIALATFRGFPWRKVPIYILAQVLGAMFGAAVVYANYYHAINIFEGPGVRTLKTAGLFSTYALDYMTNASAFFDEFLGTAVLFITVLAMGDKNNLEPPSGLAPLVLFFLVLGIGAALGMQTGYAINPARDLGPRILTAMVGYGKEVFTFRNHYWIWCPIVAPILGALVGALIYDTFLFTGEESIMNRTGKSQQSQTAQINPMPAGHAAEFAV